MEIAFGKTVQTPSLVLKITRTFINMEADVVDMMGELCHGQREVTLL